MVHSMKLKAPSQLLAPVQKSTKKFKTRHVFISNFPRPKNAGKHEYRGHVSRGGIAVKDNIATTDGRTTCASGILQNHCSPFEAHVVERLRAGGRHLDGKTNLDEFGMGSHSTNSFFGTVHNARPRGFSVGGSSGGSAVAVVTARSAAALGTDTGGSVRLPAAYTGIAGFKPSYGLISRWGVVPYANSLDTVGILALSVQTISETFNLARGHDSRDPTSPKDRLVPVNKIHLGSKHLPSEKGNSLAGITIGVPVEYIIEELSGHSLQAWSDALKLLRAEGCTIVAVSLPNTKHALSAYYIIAPAEAASNLSKYDGVRYGTRSDTSDGAGDVLYSNSRGEGFGDEVKRRILLGSYTLSSEAMDNYFIKAQKIRRLVQQDFNRVFSLPNPLCPPEQFDLSDMDESVTLKDKLGPTQVDFIVCPTAPTIAPRHDEVASQTPLDSYMIDVFTVPASLAGLPAISVPFSPFNEEDVYDVERTLGIQVIGQYSDDDRVLSLASHLEKLLSQDRPLRKQRREEQQNRDREVRIQRHKARRKAYILAKLWKAKLALKRRRKQLKVESPRIRKIAPPLIHRYLMDSPSGSRHSKPLDARGRGFKIRRYHNLFLIRKLATRQLKSKYPSIKELVLKFHPGTGVKGELLSRVHTFLDKANGTSNGVSAASSSSTQRRVVARRIRARSRPKPEPRIRNMSHKEVSNLLESSLSSWENLASEQGVAQGPAPTSVDKHKADEEIDGFVRNLVASWTGSTRKPKIDESDTTEENASVKPRKP